MAIKTFGVGEVLTAADTNTYLANSGLVFVKSQTVGSAVSTVTVSDAFSATYDNYRIMWTGGTGSTNSDIRLNFIGATTNYQSTIAYVAWGASTPQAASSASAAYMAWMGSLNLPSVIDVSVYGPFITQYTMATSEFWETNGGIGRTQGRHSANTSHTGFVFTPSTGTMTGGTITVYGYRKA